MRDILAALILAALGVAGFAWARSRGIIGQRMVSIGVDHMMTPTEGAGKLISVSRRAWSPPEAAGPYLGLIATVERAYQMPSGFLLRLLYQESRFRPDIIDGRVLSSKGAQGIAQVMPATARSPGYGVPPLSNPLNPNEAIPWAGAYLSAMYKLFKSWPLAAAAYNAGAGTVRKYLQHGTLPLETVNYVREISQDLPTLA